MKRLLSAILTIAMILALVPAVFAAEGIELPLEGKTFSNSSTGNDDPLYSFKNGVAALEGMNTRRYGVFAKSSSALFVEFSVSKSGNYTLELKTSSDGVTNRKTAAAPAIYIVDAQDSRPGGMTATIAEGKKRGYFNFSALTDTNYAPMTINSDGTETGKSIEFTLEGNKNYYMIFHGDLTSLALNPYVTSSDSPDGTKELVGYKMSSSGTTVQINGTNLLTTDDQNIYVAGIRLTPVAPAEDEELKAAFEPDNSDATVYAPSVDAVTTVAGTSATKQANGSYKMIAPETDKNGNKFLYWAKGLSLNKKIVSLEREFTYTPATGDRNYLIPVYAPESATGNEYYNANGQLIDCATEAPALPSMAGYGVASGWAQYEDTNIYVAEYDNKTQPEDVKVTVNGTEKEVPYGTDVTCTAEDKDANDNPFKCWIKSGINGKEEIVSCDKNYTFKAWENCSVTAVYEEHIYTGAKMKIIIDSFTVGSETGVMAEFIGLDSAVEKGIMFGTQKIAMTKPGTQFTVTADENGTYKGYAIVEDGEGGYTLITDGSYTK